MSNPDSSDGSERLSPGLASLLRDGASKVVPLPPVEPLLEKWKRLHSPAQTAEVVAFADFTGADALAYAARSGSAISVETRAKLAQLLREMKDFPGSNDGR